MVTSVNKPKILFVSGNELPKKLAAQEGSLSLTPGNVSEHLGYIGSSINQVKRSLDKVINEQRPEALVIANDGTRFTQRAKEFAQLYGIPFNEADDFLSEQYPAEKLKQIDNKTYSERLNADPPVLAEYQHPDMKDGEKIRASVFSDVHLSNLFEGVVNNAKTSSKFADRIRLLNKSVQRADNKAREELLILNGDFLDYTYSYSWKHAELPTNKFGQIKDIDKLKAVNKDLAQEIHGDVFAELRNFLKASDNSKILYMLGNHDDVLKISPELRESLLDVMTKEITEDGRTKEIPGARNRIIFADSAKINQLGLHVEHGHRIDEECFSNDGGPAGGDWLSYIIGNVCKKLNERLETIQNDYQKQNAEKITNVKQVLDMLEDRTSMQWLKDNYAQNFGEEILNSIDVNNKAQTRKNLRYLLFKLELPMKRVKSFMKDVQKVSYIRSTSLFTHYLMGLQKKVRENKKIPVDAQQQILADQKDEFYKGLDEAFNLIKGDFASLLKKSQYFSGLYNALLQIALLNNPVARGVMKSFIKYKYNKAHTNKMQLEEAIKIADKDPKTVATINGHTHIFGNPNVLVRIGDKMKRIFAFNSGTFIPFKPGFAFKDPRTDKKSIKFGAQENYHSGWQLSADTNPDQDKVKVKARSAAKSVNYSFRKSEGVLGQAA